MAKSVELPEDVLPAGIRDVRPGWSVGHVNNELAVANVDGIEVES